MRKINIPPILIHLALFAVIVGFAAFFGEVVMGFVLAAVLLLLNLTLRGAGKLISGNPYPQKWFKALLILINTLVLICGLLYIVQDGFFFFNISDDQSRNFLRELPNNHEIYFTAGNGKTYHGMMYREESQNQSGEQKVPLIIYFGGNGECASGHFGGNHRQSRWSHFAGYNYLYVDYEGYGLNDGNPCHLNIYEQVLAVYDWAVMLPYVDGERIAVMGYSLGTGGAVYLAANRPVTGLILVAPYANGYDLYNNALPIFHGALKILARHKFVSDKHAPNVDCPILVIASKADEIVPFESSKRLAKLFPGGLEAVEFFEIENVLHNDIFSLYGVYDSIQAFLERINSAETR
ncbi:MAG: dienelactone hydrolase family protein [Oscillospiraceae bacterium]|nr:dienelactone hydrolase family protein [Oscillospiraceae bacterium]